MVAPSGPDIRIFVLDAMQDDIENLASIVRYLGEWQRFWPHDFTDEEVLDTLRTLLEDELVEAFEESPADPGLVRVTQPAKEEAALREYWFSPTVAGRDLWRAWDAPVPMNDEGKPAQ